MDKLQIRERKEYAEDVILFAQQNKSVMDGSIDWPEMVRMQAEKHIETLDALEKTLEGGGE